MENIGAGHSLTVVGKFVLAGPFISVKISGNVYYTPICAHGPPLDTTPTLPYKPIGILDGGIGNSGSEILIGRSLCDHNTNMTNVAATNTASPAVKHRIECNLKNKINAINVAVRTVTYLGFHFEEREGELVTHSSIIL